MVDAMQKEWLQWRELCAVLERHGVVTRVDLEAKAGTTATPGQEILTTIKMWGERMRELGAAHGA